MRNAGWRRYFWSYLFSDGKGYSEASKNIELRDGSLLIGQIGRKPFQIFGREFFIKTE